MLNTWIETLVSKNLGAFCKLSTRGMVLLTPSEAECSHSPNKPISRLLFLQSRRLRNNPRVQPKLITSNPWDFTHLLTPNPVFILPPFSLLRPYQLVCITSPRSSSDKPAFVLCHIGRKSLSNKYKQKVLRRLRFWNTFANILLVKMNYIILLECSSWFLFLPKFQIWIQFLLWIPVVFHPIAFQLQGQELKRILGSWLFRV